MLKPVSIAALMFIAACEPGPTATRGDLLIFSTDSISPVIAAAGHEFGRLYQQVSVTVHATSTGEAILHLLNDSATAVATDRALTTEEELMASQFSDQITTTVWGADALVVIVNTGNSLRQMTLQTLSQILSGAVRSWADVTGSEYRDSINLFLAGRSSGSYELLSDHFFDLPSLSVGTFELNDRDVIRRVARERNSMGIVSFSTLKSPRDAEQEIKAVRSIVLDQIAVSQQSIHDKTYPLRYDLFLLTKERKAGPAAGFAAFLAGVNGQIIVQKAGIVPATIPSREIQLTP